MKIPITLLFLLLLSFSCSDDVIEKDPKSEDSEEEALSWKRISINVSNNNMEQDKRINLYHSPLELKKNITSKTPKEDYFWELVGEINSPIIDGMQLSATHLAIRGNLAIITYHKQGDFHKGALDIVDIGDPGHPKIIHHAILPNADINGCAADISGTDENLVLWLAISDKQFGAGLLETRITGGILQSSARLVKLSPLISQDGKISASANGVTQVGDYLYISTGRTFGGTVSLKKEDLSLHGFEEYPNSKFIMANARHNSARIVSLVTGERSQLKIYVAGFKEAYETFNIGSIIHQNVANPSKGKSSMMFSPHNKNHIMVAKAREGIGTYDILTGKKVFTSNSSMLVKGNTNGLSSDKELIYMANGADGLSIALYPAAGISTISPLYTWDLEEAQASANFVSCNGKLILVSKGQGGVKILKKGYFIDDLNVISDYDENGVPLDLEKDIDICPPLLDHIFNKTLPQGQDAQLFHPEFFEGKNSNLIIKEKGKIKITFISGKSDYKNVLGYYFYPAGNPPQSLEDLNIKIIFPHVSADNPTKGNTIELTEEFKEETVIGFFLIANGWNGSRITDGYYSLYSNAEFNKGIKPQNLLLFDQTCQSIILAFEDIPLPYGDKDYNDAVFQITSEPASAIDTQDLIIISE